MLLPMRAYRDWRRLHQLLNVPGWLWCGVRHQEMWKPTSRPRALRAFGGLAVAQEWACRTCWRQWVRYERIRSRVRMS